MLNRILLLLGLERSSQIKLIIDNYKEISEGLLHENTKIKKELRELRLENRIIKLYVDDDDALLELFTLRKEKKREKKIGYQNYYTQAQGQAQAQAQAQGLYNTDLFFGRP